MNVCTKLCSNPSNSCQDILPKIPNVNLLLVHKEKWGDLNVIPY